jgi:hypothetical protein
MGLLESSISRDNDTNSAAPIATSVFVLSPAGCCRNCRSKPIATPNSVFAMKCQISMRHPARWDLPPPALAAVRENIPCRRT